ncbi:ice-binding family protein [Plantactinospora sp. CA-290183]|uniref:ice-binding family protein n=1 Tax=Plantactinospora sp. CA-290183 TaxID=3240006 RepID=UPI003D8BBAC4
MSTVLVGVAATPSASAATPPVPLGSAADFAVLAGTTVTNAGASVINGDIGVSPGTAVTGFPPGQLNGDVHDGTLDVGRTAYTLTGGAGDNAATWNPVVSVRVPLSAVAGVYTATVTFSVA